MGAQLIRAHQVDLRLPLVGDALLRQSHGGARDLMRRRRGLRRAQEGLLLYFGLDPRHAVGSVGEILCEGVVALVAQIDRRYSFRDRRVGARPLRITIFALSLSTAL